MTTKDTKPAKPTFSQDSGKAGTNQDGNAAHVENSTVANELARIADELHQLNRSLTITRRDGTEVVGLARLIAENGNGRVRR